MVTAVVGLCFAHLLRSSRPETLGSAGKSMASYPFFLWNSTKGGTSPQSETNMIDVIFM